MIPAKDPHQLLSYENPKGKLKAKIKDKKLNETSGGKLGRRNLEEKSGGELGEGNREKEKSGGG